MPSNKRCSEAPPLVTCSGTKMPAVSLGHLASLVMVCNADGIRKLWGCSQPVCLFPDVSFATLVQAAAIARTLAAGVLELSLIGQLGQYVPSPVWGMLSV